MKKCGLVSCFILAVLFCAAGCSEPEVDTQAFRDILVEAETELQQPPAEESIIPEPEFTIDEVPVYTPEPHGELITDLGITPTEEETPQPMMKPTAEPSSEAAPESTPEPIVGYIDARSLNMREKPTTDSDIIKEYEGNQNVEIVSEDGDWYKVAIGSNVGYMLKEYIAVNEPVQPTKAITTPKPEQSNYKEKDGYVDARSLNLRAEPSTDADIVKEFSEGQTLKIVGETDGWYKVVIGGITGYMTKDYVSLGAPPKPTEAPTRGNSGTDEGSSAMVWIPTNGGKKYHSSSRCSNMIVPDYVTLDEAIDLGFTACKRCH